MRRRRRSGPNRWPGCAARSRRRPAARPRRRRKPAGWRRHRRRRGPGPSRRRWSTPRFRTWCPAGKTAGPTWPPRMSAPLPRWRRRPARVGRLRTAEHAGQRPARGAAGQGRGADRGGRERRGRVRRAAGRQRQLSAGCSGRLPQLLTVADGAQEAIAAALGAAAGSVASAGLDAAVDDHRRAEAPGRRPGRPGDRSGAGRTGQQARADSGCRRHRRPGGAGRRRSRYPRSRPCHGAGRTARARSRSCSATWWSSPAWPMACGWSGPTRGCGW